MNRTGLVWLGLVREICEPSRFRLLNQMAYTGTWPELCALSGQWRRCANAWMGREMVMDLVTGCGQQSDRLMWLESAGSWIWLGQVT